MRYSAMLLITLNLHYAKNEVEITLTEQKIKNDPKWQSHVTLWLQLHFN